LSGGKTLGVLLEALDAEELRANRVLGLAMKSRGRILQSTTDEVLQRNSKSGLLSVDPMSTRLPG